LKWLNKPLKLHNKTRNELVAVEKELGLFYSHASSTIEVIIMDLSELSSKIII